jgi:four helix bundle protein
MSYEDLQVYQRAYRASLSIHRLITQRDDLADQIRRASRSVTANIAEGYNRLNTPTEICRFLVIAIRSADEVRVWLDYCRDLQRMDLCDAESLKSEYEEIGAMLSGLWKSWKQKNRSRQTPYELRTMIYELVSVGERRTLG